MQPLVREDDALPGLCQHGFDSVQLERQLHTFLGQHLAQEDMCATVFMFANVTTQLAGGEPLSPEAVLNTVTETYPFGVPNAVTSYLRSLAPSPVAKPSCYGLVAMTGYATESIFDLLTEELLNSGSVSSTGSHHPSLECHIAELHEGLVECLGPNGESPKRQGVPPPAPAPGDDTPKPQTP